VVGKIHCGGRIDPIGGMTKDVEEKSGGEKGEWGSLNSPHGRGIRDGRKGKSESKGMARSVNKKPRKTCDYGRYIK